MKLNEYLKSCFYLLMCSGIVGRHCDLICHVFGYKTQKVFVPVCFVLVLPYIFFFMFENPVMSELKSYIYIYIYYYLNLKLIKTHRYFYFKCSAFYSISTGIKYRYWLSNVIPFTFRSSVCIV